MSTAKNKPTLAQALIISTSCGVMWRFGWEGFTIAWGVFAALTVIGADTAAAVDTNKE